MSLRREAGTLSRVRSAPVGYARHNKSGTDPRRRLRPPISPDARPPESLAAAARPASTGRQLTIALPPKTLEAGLCFATVPIVASTALVVTVGDHRTVCSPQPAAADRRPPARGAAPPRRTNLAPPATPISLCCFSLGCGVAPGDDVRLRDGRQSCASPTTRGCRRKREQSLPAASLWLLAQEPDVDPARVPEATGATIRGHRRRDRDRLDGVGDQPSPSR
jgi:hypothetical protein